MEYRITSIEKKENEGYREVLVTLNNGTVIHIAACDESWELSGGTTEELYITFDVAELYNEWLHGGDEPFEWESNLLITSNQEHDFDESILDKDIYYVEEHDGKKCVNVQRYYYYDDFRLRVVEFAGIRITEFPIKPDKVQDIEEESKQYTSFVSVDEIKKDIEDIQELPIEEVNEDTPCGKYIDKYW